ncbi:hypothetical protein Tco_1072365 [Tanacetum coccineum]
MLAPSGGGLILYQAYRNLYAMTGRKAHLLEDKQIQSVGVFAEILVVLLLVMDVHVRRFANQLLSDIDVDLCVLIKVNGWFWRLEMCTLGDLGFKTEVEEMTRGLDMCGDIQVLTARDGIQFLLAAIQWMLLEEADLEHGLEHVVCSSYRANPGE